MPFVTAEEACKAATPAVPFDICIAEQTAWGVRAREVGSQCTAAFQHDVAGNNRCRTICWNRTDDAASCALEATTWISNQREIEDAQRNHLIAMGLLLAVIVVIVSLLIVKRTRSAIGSFFARGIYAVSGFDVRKVSERWDGYRPQEWEDSPQQIAPSGGIIVRAAVPKFEKRETHRKGGSMVVLLNIGRALMWLWIINGIGHLLLGPDVLGAIQQPFYMFACILQIIAAIAFLSLMTRAIRRRMHPGSQVEPPTGNQ